MSNSATLAVTLSIERAEKLTAIAERENSTPGAPGLVASELADQWIGNVGE